MLVIFSGGSGVGKNTVIERLILSGDYALMPTYTTREKRINEKDGNPYYFITDEEFFQKLSEGEFYEYQKVHNHYYGTSKKLLNDCMASGKILLKDIDVLGTQNLLKTIGDNIKMITLFLRVDSVEELERRLRGRGEADIELRLKRYQMEQQYAIGYDYVITNNDLEKTLTVTSAVIGAEKAGRYPRCACRIGQTLSEEVERAIEDLLKEERPQPVKVALKEGELYIVEGHARYLAALSQGKRIAKEIVDSKRIEAADESAWREAVERYSLKN